MASSLSNLFSRENINLVVGLITLLVILWLIMYTIPGIFVSLFNTSLGNLILFIFIILAAMYNTNLAIGLAVVFIILWRFSHMGPSMIFEKFII